MSKRAKQARLDELHAKLTEAFINILDKGVEVFHPKTGEREVIGATAAHLAVITKFLKDNGIEAVPDEAAAKKALTEMLPFPTADDADEIVRH